MAEGVLVFLIIAAASIFFLVFAFLIALALMPETILGAVLRFQNEQIPAMYRWSVHRTIRYAGTRAFKIHKQRQLLRAQKQPNFDRAAFEAEMEAQKPGYIREVGSILARLYRRGRMPIPDFEQHVNSYPG